MHIKALNMHTIVDCVHIIKYSLPVCCYTVEYHFVQEIHQEKCPSFPVSCLNKSEILSILKGNTDYSL